MSSLGIFLLILLCYVIAVYLMYREVLPVIWGLPLMAVTILGIIAVMQPGTVTLKDLYALFTEGPNRIGATIMSFVFAGIFARSQIDSGIVENVVKRAAELGGDRPLAVTLLLGLASAYVSLGAFGGAAFVAHAIALPIMLSLGLSPVTATAIQGFAAVQAMSLWAQHWSYLGTFTKVGLEQMYPFLMLQQAVITATWIVFTVLTFKREGLPLRWAVTTEPSAFIEQKVPTYSLICPVLPLFFILAMKMPDIVAFTLSTVLTILLTQPGSGRKLADMPGLFSKIYLNGINDMKYLIALMIGIGFILRVADFPFTKKVLSESLLSLLPRSPLAFILFFGVYMLIGGIFRGPAMPWALGAAVFTSIVGTQTYPLGVTGALVAVINWFSGIADPTTGYHVYLCALSKTSPVDYMKRVYLPAAISGVVGIVLTTFYYGMW